MPKKPSKSAISSKAKKVKVSKKAATPANEVKLIECFMRDMSWESFLPPSLYPAEGRDMDFNLAATVRPIDQNFSCVDVAMRLRVSSQGREAFLIYEMIYEGVFNVSCANESEAQRLYIEGGPQVYERCHKAAMALLGSHGLKPPLPAKVDFAAMWQQGTK